jgi:predicted permease
MRILREWIHRLRGTLLPGRRDGDLKEELRLHVEMAAEDARRRGRASADAARDARLKAGGASQAMDALRDQRGLPWIEDLVRDVRLGFRATGRDRLFTVSVATILGVGIGASVAMFSVLNAVVLRPLPYDHPGELAVLATHDISQNQWDGTSVPNFFDWRQQGISFAGMTFYRRTQVSQVTVGSAGGPQRVREGLVGPDFFDLLGATPIIGRTFARQEFERRERVMVLSEGLWQEQFAGSNTALGRRLSIGGEDHVVIGVMARTFQLPTADTRLWRPITVLASLRDIARSGRDGDGIEVIGRLKPGVSIENARAEMGVIAARLREQHAVNRNRDIRVIPLFDHVVGTRASRAVWLGFGAVMAMLAIACANVSGLLTARAAQRRRELAVRSALGAGRSRLVRQLLAEGVSVWAVASAVGLLLAYGSIRLVLAYGPRALPRMEQVGLDRAALALACVGGLSVVLLSGTIPASIAAKVDARAAFGTRDESSLPSRRLQDLLVTGQIAGTLVLLVGALLLAQSFIRAQREDPGYTAEHLLVVRIDHPSRSTFFREAQDRIRRLPGVIAVGGIKQFFLRRNPDQRVTIEGRDAAPDEGPPSLSVDAATPGYFRSMGIELLEGRDFDDRDLAPGSPRVSIVNETMARRFWPNKSAVGQRWIGGGSPPKDGRWTTVVGVVKDMRREGLDLAPIAAAFVPDLFSQNFDMTIRASTRVDTLIPAVRRELRSIDSALPITDIASADGRLSQRLGGRRFETQLFVVFAAIALLLSAAGVYASLAYQVARRTREIGIRSALGADRLLIIRMIVGKGMRLALAGAALGVCGAASVARVMQSVLYETTAINPTSYAASAVFVLLVAAVAAWVPARRAAAVSSITALREA